MSGPGYVVAFDPALANVGVAVFAPEIRARHPRGLRGWETAGLDTKLHTLVALDHTSTAGSAALARRCAEVGDFAAHALARWSPALVIVEKPAHAGTYRGKKERESGTGQVALNAASMVAFHQGYGALLAAIWRITRGAVPILEHRVRGIPGEDKAARHRTLRLLARGIPSALALIDAGVEHSRDACCIGLDARWELRS